MDIYYIILVIPAYLLTLAAQMYVQSTFNRYSSVPIARGLTGASAADAVLRFNGVGGVSIGRISGKLTDHYDPRTNVINLSDSTYGAASVASAGVAAHEAGHAVQYAVGYSPIRLRAAIIPICSFGASTAWPVLLIGLFLGMQSLVTVGIILFSASAVFQLVTLPVEFDASRRAIASLESAGLMTDDELEGARKVLRAAALTYVAALAMSVASLLRLVLLFGSRGRRD